MARRKPLGRKNPVRTEKSGHTQRENAWLSRYQTDASKHGAFMLSYCATGIFLVYFRATLAQLHG